MVEFSDIRFNILGDIFFNVFIKMFVNKRRKENESIFFDKICIKKVDLIMKGGKFFYVIVDIIEEEDDV